MPISFISMAALTSVTEGMTEHTQEINSCIDIAMATIIAH